MKLHNEELRDLYSSPSISRMINSGHVARKGKKRNVYMLLVRKPEARGKETTRKTKT
jgi:hypothetical protein